MFVLGWLARLQGMVSANAERREVENVERELRAELDKVWQSMTRTQDNLASVSGDLRALQQQVSDMKERIGTMSQDVSTTLRIATRLEAELIRQRPDDDRGHGQQ